MTYGEIIDWLKAAKKRREDDLEMLKTQAWFYGIAFNRAYVAAKDPNQQYPALKDMFPEADQKKNDQTEVWKADRAEMAMILQANAKKR